MCLKGDPSLDVSNNFALLICHYAAFFWHFAAGSLSIGATFNSRENFIFLPFSTRIKVKAYFHFSFFELFELTVAKAWRADSSESQK